MVLQAPHGFVYVISAFLAMIGILAVMPTNLSIPDLAAENAAWFIFLAWFLLAVATAMPSSASKKEDAPAKAAAPDAHAKPAAMAEHHEEVLAPAAHEDHAPARPAAAH
jgi:hypothetical protein